LILSSSLIFIIINYKFLHISGHKNKKNILLTNRMFKNKTFLSFIKKGEAKTSPLL